MNKWRNKSAKFQSMKDHKIRDLLHQLRNEKGLSKKFRMIEAEEKRIGSASLTMSKSDFDIFRFDATVSSTKLFNDNR